MGTKDARVDLYIANAATFARPILHELREMVHEGCPDVEESIKWSRPFFLYKGMFCYMSEFKHHCAFGFWSGSRILGEDVVESGTGARGQFGRITSLQDLPPRRTFLNHVKKAAKLKDKDAASPPPPKPRRTKPPLAVPDYLTAALRKNKKAQAAFESFSPSQRRDYIEWLIEAKAETTRQRRLETAIEWISEGKSRNWKYEKC
jgi:uncharacterized protein YdeI (YjbR/CyaY-like superfamily)